MTKPYQSTDPDAEHYIDWRTVQVALAEGLDPWALDWHVEAEHGWETHDVGFMERGLAGAVACLKAGGCTGG